MNVTGSNQVYDKFLLELAKGAVQPESDSLIAGLSGSGYVPDLAHETIADITAELAGNGYARQTLTNVAVSLEFGIVKIDCDDFAFAASGGDLTGRYWWVFDDSHASDILVCYGLINQRDEDVVIIDGQPLAIHINQNGIVRLKRFV